ncbi:sensor histidine kinase [Alicyclobacillus sp. SO9]|uniref:sensor histidine kinase n=1 Tax=Alicyclobacillus sp. SO9 TaxID=2665646 RepID=UPI0018E86070|nr:sensor histidine kinase [Alicyclobacillus sp. SO9]QQE79445.1 sensor histidine kinase [Alicyclobacillus sp. SO9]
MHQKPDTARIVDLLEEERKRLARDIHDGPAQSLTNVTMRLKVVKRLLESERQTDAKAELDRLQSFLRAAINDVRRLIFDLRPTFLENGITEAVQRYSQRFSQSTGLKIDVAVAWESPQLAHSTEVALFRVCQEALNNTFKHAEASSVTIVLDTSDEGYLMSIRDDGKGFQQTSNSLISFGLQGMEERMALVGGIVRVHSTVGHGTTVVCEVPRYND